MQIVSQKLIVIVDECVQNMFGDYLLSWLKTARDGSKILIGLDIMFAYYEGHPIKNETFFIVKKSVCVFS